MREVRLRPSWASARQLSRRCACEGWWAVTDSNRRHSACKADALPTELTALRRHVSPSTRSTQAQRARPGHVPSISAQKFNVRRTAKKYGIRIEALGGLDARRGDPCSVYRSSRSLWRLARAPSLTLNNCRPSRRRSTALWGKEIRRSVTPAIPTSPSTARPNLRSIRRTFLAFWAASRPTGRI
jgi:hypothetical protein